MVIDISPSRHNLMKYWAHWLSLHGAARLLLRREAKRGDPFHQLLLGTGGSEGLYLRLEQIRQRGRVHRTALATVTVDHAFTRGVLRDNRFISIAPSNIAFPWPLGRMVEMTDPGLPDPMKPPAMLVVDPPDHARYRGPVSRAFTPRAVNRLTDWIHQVVGGLLDELETKPKVDLIQDFGAKIPAAIIANILGVPAGEIPRLLDWNSDASVLLDLGVSWPAYRAAAISLACVDRYFSEHIERLRVAEDQGILSTIVRDSDLDPLELKANAFLLMGAGSGTTGNLIGNAIVELHDHPEQLALLRDDPSLWPNAIEELLRYRTPGQWTGRIATGSFEIDGVPVEKDEIVFAMLGGANRDPAVFDNPDTLDITRPNARDHLAFGSGVHSCIGASLARMQGVVAIQALFERFPDLRLEGTPERRPLVNLHGYDHIPAVLRADRATPAHPLGV